MVLLWVCHYLPGPAHQKPREGIRLQKHPHPPQQASGPLQTVCPASSHGSFFRPCPGKSDCIPTMQAGRVHGRLMTVDVM